MPQSKEPLTLVIDDDAAYLEIISSCLQAGGIRTETAQGAAQGLKRAKELVPDLILLDMNMPDTNGTEVLIDLKKDPKMRNTKVAFLTTLVNPWPGITAPSKKFALELGAVDYLDKTRDLVNIVKKVREILEVK